MNGLYFIGLEHYDLDGPEGLRELIEFLSPDAVAVEACDEKAGIIEKNYAMFNEIRLYPERRELFLSEMQDMGFNRETVDALYLSDIGINYDYLVPERYCRQAGVPIYLVDNPDRTLGVVLEDIAGNSSSGSVTEEEYSEMFLSDSPQQLQQLSDDVYSIRSVEAQCEYDLKFRKEAFVEVEGREPDENELLRMLQDKDVEIIGLTDHLIRSNEYMEGELRKVCAKHEKVVYVVGRAHVGLKYPFGENNLSENMSDLGPVVLDLCDVDDIISCPSDYLRSHVA